MNKLIIKSIDVIPTGDFITPVRRIKAEFQTEFVVFCDKCGKTYMEFKLNSFANGFTRLDTIKKCVQNYLDKKYSDFSVSQRASTDWCECDWIWSPSGKIHELECEWDNEEWRKFFHDIFVVNNQHPGIEFKQLPERVKKDLYGGRYSI